jgi:acetylornithine deacetylase
MSDTTIALLRKLVAIDSVNPSLVAGAAGEYEIATSIAAEMRDIGMEVEISEVVPGRPNVVGVLSGPAKGLSLMFLGHTDTVGVAGMEAPFCPMERDGRLYGRGAQDMKGGIAAMIGAARQVAESGGLKSGKLIVAAVADEEHASLGAEHLVGRWSADGAVVTEPTGLTPVITHKGFAWIEITTHGRAAHGSRPAEGRDAILRMGRVLGRLEALDRALQRSTPHPLQGTGSLHASLIHGGRELSTYPDLCTVQLERRTTSLEPAGIALREIEEIFAALKMDDQEFEASAKLLFERSPLDTSPEHLLSRLLKEELRRAGRDAEPAAVSYWTDAAILASSGIPTLIFGPGGAGMHGAEEYVNVGDVLACRDVLAALAKSFTSQ